jgi:hypothetical protein
MALLRLELCECSKIGSVIRLSSHRVHFQSISHLNPCGSSNTFVVIFCFVCALFGPWFAPTNTDKAGPTGMEIVFYFSHGKLVSVK